MKLTVLLAVSLCVTGVSDVSGTNENGDCIGLCKSEDPKSEKIYLKYGRRWDNFVYPRYPYLVRPYRRLEIPSSCKNIECPKSEVCHLMRPQCFFGATCRSVPICLRQSGGWIDSKESNNEVLELLSNSQNKKKIKFGLGPSLTHNKQLKDSPSASSGLEDPTVPSDQTPVLIEGLWKGGEPHSLNPGGPEIPAKSVSANSSQILVNSVRLNDSESCEDPESFENSKSSEYFENRVKAWLLESADIKVNPWALGRQKGGRRDPFEWKLSALNDPFGAGSWFTIRHQSGEKLDDVGGKAKKRVHRDK